jgi:hypothetical protein
MSDLLNEQQTNDWVQAVVAVENVAANTDTESSSKSHMDAMAHHVRTEPRTVLRALAIV